MAMKTLWAPSAAWIRGAPWKTTARMAPTTMPAVKVGRVGFFRTIRTTTTTGGSRSRGLRLKLVVTVLMIAS